MISLREHIDNHRDALEEPIPRGGEMVEPVLTEFRAIVLAIGQCTTRAIPSLGGELSRKMKGFERQLALPVTPDVLSKASRQAQIALSQWADRAALHEQAAGRELREIISVVSLAVESLGERDKKYADEFGGLTGRLSAIAEENDLALVRRSIMESTRALKDCFARMAKESKASLDHLTAEVKEYRTRLREAEEASETDQLTNLANRRALEKQMESRMAAREPFCLMMIDLNDFKPVNDNLGHVAGDDLLKQFAGELASQFEPGELVGRWGGDEFLVIVGGHLDLAQARMERVRKWTFGEYKVTTGERRSTVILTAAIGVAEWDGKETGQKLLARADKELYRAK